MKLCQKCECLKDKADFYRQPRSKDGLGTNCKECVKAYARAKRDRDPEASRAADRERYRTDANRRSQVRTKSKAWHLANPERSRAFQREWYRRNPEKKRAHTLVHRALQSGKLVRGRCEVCAVSEVEAHHDDYDKPLEVRWLCTRHHGETRLK